MRNDTREEVAAAAAQRRLQNHFPVNSCVYYYLLLRNVTLSNVHKNKDYLIYFRTATFKSNFLCNVKVKERLVMKYSLGYYY